MLAGMQYMQYDVWQPAAPAVAPACGSQHRQLITAVPTLAMQASAPGGASSRLLAFSDPAVERAQLQHLAGHEALPGGVQPSALRCCMHCTGIHFEAFMADSF